MAIKGSILCLLLAATTQCSNDQVDNYVELIKKESQRAYRTFAKDSSEYQSPDEVPSYYGTFHYIIIGGGSAGAVITTRLSEDPGTNVLLIEAGGTGTDFTEIPSMNDFTLGLEFNWNYNSTPQTTACLGTFNQECPYPTGKGLGGGSTVNSLMYVRCNRRDYDNWYRKGNRGWAYKDVLPYFIKSERSHINGDPGYHGYDGLFNVEYHKPSSIELGAFIQANVELGRKIVDYNGKEQLGVAKTQHNTKNGRRHSTWRAFLKPVIHRPNLKILTHSLATKVLINKDKKAYGVAFSGNGSFRYAIAEREVVLSAGAVGSPQLLMLSGIGPRKHLQSIGIPVIQHLSVGDNLQNHCRYTVYFVTNNTEPAKTLEQNVKDYLNGSGPLTIAENGQGLGFLRTKLSKVPGYPDVELVVSPPNCTATTTQQILHYTDEVMDAIYKKIAPSQTFAIHVVPLHPKSWGTIRLSSKSPYKYPLIDPKFFSDRGNEDLETMRQGIQLALQIVDTEPFRKIGARLLDASLPACQAYRYLSRKYWYCHIRQLALNVYHSMGTCKMGPRPSRGAVVDDQLRVHGVEGLRVADASVIPEAVSGHTNAVAIMIGEKVSDLIKASD
ncbi:glucose dehydrogenase [FAD, quinone]-like [Photinus pyralis]|uniref:glucose dehydrogenase [FAD, quinone]-like n=1 Tax=Photinus pyralis TaxID=7054 RepID=UPI0012672279|nr:glucose dehydrogenase [FAD, quinone]-like [Photinus pyralis]